MIENLLHAKIVLSKENLEALRAKKGANIPSLIGMITFLGCTDDEDKIVNLLFRLDSAAFDTLRSIHVIEAVLGQRVVTLNGNKSVNSAPRLTAIVHLNKKLENPIAYLRALRKKVADECTRHIIQNNGAGSFGYY